MNEWDKLQAENEARQPVEIKRRVEAAEAEVRIMHEVRGLLIGAFIIIVTLALIGFIWATWQG